MIVKPKQEKARSEEHVFESIADGGLPIVIEH